jgi:hypothetical protein
MRFASVWSWVRSPQGAHWDLWVCCSSPCWAGKQATRRATKSASKSLSSLDCHHSLRESEREREREREWREGVNEKERDGTMSGDGESERDARNSKEAWASKIRVASWPRQPRLDLWFVQLPDLSLYWFRCPPKNNEHAGFISGQGGSISTARPTSPTPH